MRIAVLMGGDSPERDVSLETGRAVAAALVERGHEVREIDLPSVAQVVDLAAELRAFDVVFPALHGGQGEDGHLQAVLDVLKISYALSGPRASAIAMDKAVTKQVMRAAGIPTPDWLQVTWDRKSARPGALSAADASGADESGGLTVDTVFARVSAEIGFPCVIKLNGAGSSVGVEIVERPDQFTDALNRVLAAPCHSCINVLIEKFIPGRELTATILMGRRLPLLEIRPREGFYDYRNKYTSGASEYLVPAPVHSPVYEQICADALRVYELIGCRGVARVDFRLDGDDYKCLEINTIPGMTGTSLVPKAAAAVGIGFGDLLEDLCRQAAAAD